MCMRGCGRIQLLDTGGYTVNGRRPGRLDERSLNLTVSRGMVIPSDHTDYIQPDTGHHERAIRLAADAMRQRGGAAMNR
jgi:hypothetical protein